MITARRVLNFAFLVAVVAGSAIAFWQRQAIVDWWRLKDYSPPAAVSALALSDTMTNSARHIFYVNHPKLITQATIFGTSCPQSEQTIVLGCYRSGQNGIYIYDVTDLRLDGVEEVTAAHEMLHAAFERLSQKDRQYIDSLLRDYYKNGLNDERVKKTISLYKITEPDYLVNEMHSIFGTEIADLPPALESYYQRYFSNRARVVGFSAGYEEEVCGRQDQIDGYDRQLAALKQKIDSADSTLSSQASQLANDRDRLNIYRDSGDIEAYNAAVPGFNAAVKAYNNGVAKLQKDITAYNQLVAARNALATEVRALQEAIDTRLTTQSTQ